MKRRPRGGAGPTLGQYRGCLLGGAVGDALGAPIEFDSLAAIRTKYGEAGLRDMVEAHGRIGAITDDTQMTLFTAEGLLRARNGAAGRGFVSVPSEILHAYWRWLGTQGEAAPDPFGGEHPGWLVQQPFLHARRAPGNTCLGALRSGRVLSRTETINDSKGCGGVMRVAPVGLARVIDPFETGCDAAALTHGHPTGVLAAGAFARVIAGVAAGIDLEEAVESALERLRTEPGHEETAAAIANARRLARKAKGTPEEVESLGAGWTAEEALAIGLFAALVAEDFEHGVLLAVNHGGDSDSTGSIAGNILGLRLGVDAIPGRWLGRLEGRKVISEVASDLWRTFVGGDTKDVPRAMLEKYPPS